MYFIISYVISFICFMLIIHKLRSEKANKKYTDELWKRIHALEDEREELMAQNEALKLTCVNKEAIPIKDSTISTTNGEN